MALTDPFTGMYPPDPLGKEETVQALRLDAIAELDAINLYQAHLNTIADPEARKVLEHARDEEKQHFAEFVAAIERLDPTQASYLRTLAETGQTVLPNAVADLDKAIADLDRSLAYGDVSSGDRLTFTPAEPDATLRSDPGYLYHATNMDRAYDIAESGIKTHKPWEFTDQAAWPDGSTEKRTYFSPKANNIWYFAPPEGRAVALRVPMSAVKAKQESTGDWYVTRTVPPTDVEILDTTGVWHPISHLQTPGGPPYGDVAAERVYPASTPPEHGGPLDPESWAQQELERQRLIRIQTQAEYDLAAKQGRVNEAQMLKAKLDSVDNTIRWVSDYLQGLSRPLAVEPALQSVSDEWVSGIGGSPGIVVDPGLAKATKCTRIDLGAGRNALVYSPGIIGALDESQQALYCIEGYVEREATTAQLQRLQGMSDAAKLCSSETVGVTNSRQHVEAYFSCLGRELAKKRTGG